MTTRIIVNGQEYTSPEDMPEDARRAYREAMAQLADADGNGVPDVLERGAGGGGNAIGIVHSSITVNGRTVGSADELPEPMRRLYEAAMADADRDGVPDVLEDAPPSTGGILRSELSWSIGASGPTRREEDGHPLDRFLKLLVAAAIMVVGALLVARVW